MTITKVANGTVCPVCGTVYRNGQKYAQAWGLDSWIPRIVDVRICPACKSYRWDTPKSEKEVDAAEQLTIEQISIPTFGTSRNSGDHIQVTVSQ